MSKLRMPGLAAGAGATILLSFTTQWYILTRLGASRVTDAYFAALAVPIVVLYVLGDPLNRVALPILSVRKGAEYWSYAWTTMQVSTLIFLGIGAVLFVSARGWVPFLVPGFSAEATENTISLTRIVMLGMVFQGTSIAARAAWNGRTKFIWPSMAGVIAVACSLGFLILTLKRLGVTAAVWAFNIRFGMECLLLVAPLGNYALPRWGHVPPFIRKARPLILGAAYFRTDVLVDRVLTSLAPPGGLSLLYLAQQLLSAIGQVVNQSIVTPSIPALANAAHVGNWDEFGKKIRSTIRILIGLAGAIVIALLVLGKPALSLLFAHQAMGGHDIDLLLFLLLSLGGMLLADGIVYFAYSSFYSAGDTMTPTIATAVVYSFGVVAKISAFLLAGIVGLALSISAYYVANAIVLLWLLLRKLRKLYSLGPAQPTAEVIVPVLVPQDTSVES